MLRSVDKFLVITDYKNLEYFGKPRQLSERQVRWAQFLGKFPNIEIAYRPGKENPRADALSRREQDMPEGVEDTRISRRFLQIFRPVMADSLEEEEEEEALQVYSMSISPTQGQEDGKEGPAPAPGPESRIPENAHHLESLWKEAIKQDQALKSLEVC